MSLSLFRLWGRGVQVFTLGLISVCGGSAYFGGVGLADWP